MENSAGDPATLIKVDVGQTMSGVFMFGYLHRRPDRFYITRPGQPQSDMIAGLIWNFGHGDRGCESAKVDAIPPAIWL